MCITLLIHCKGIMNFEISKLFIIFFHKIFYFNQNGYLPITDFYFLEKTSGLFIVLYYITIFLFCNSNFYNLKMFTILRHPR